jgi:hypothetical protein
MTTNGLAVPVDVPASGAPADRSRRRKGGKPTPGRHRAPTTLGFVHDGIVVDIGGKGTVELSVGSSDDASLARDRQWYRHTNRGAGESFRGVPSALSGKPPTGSDRVRRRLRAWL